MRIFLIISLFISYLSNAQLTSLVVRNDTLFSVIPTTGEWTQLTKIGWSQLTTKPTLGTLAAQNGTFSGVSSGTNTGDDSPNSLYSGLAASKQDVLISGSSIKTINNTSLLGNGNIDITAGATAWGGITGTISNQSDLQIALGLKQNTITTGNTLQYFRGDLSLATFPTTTASFTSSTNKNFVTDAQLTIIGNQSGTNSGDNATNTQYSGLAASKQNVITTGTTAQYFRGDLSLATFPTTTAAFINSTNKNFVTDAQLTVIGNTSGANTGDNATNTQYSGLAASKQDALVSGVNIKTINGTTILGSGNLVVSAGAATSTSGVGTSPTASSTTTVTHNLGRVPIVIRIYGYGTFTSNAAATATTSSMGIFSSSGNFCVYQRYGAAITTTQAGLSSNVFAILLATGGGNFISGVIQNVTSTQFDIAWTETGTATAQPYLWEAQQP